MLSPHRLTTKVRSDGLAVVPEYARWIEAGLAAHRWMTPPPDVADPLMKRLDKKVTCDFHEVPLNEVAKWFAADLETPVQVDRQALEGIGLSLDVAITGRCVDQSAHAALGVLLHDIECEVTIRNEVLLITTREWIETEPLIRVYFLEGTGVHFGDYESAMMEIMNFIDPDTWAVSSQPVEMGPLAYGESNRHALVVSVPLSTHRKIAGFLDGLRAIAVGPDGGNEPDFGIVPR